MLKVCVLMRTDHITNPIQASIEMVCKDKGYDILDLGETDKTAEYDLCIIYYNKVIQTKATKNVWWLCDLRPAYIWNYAKYDHIFLCNKEHLDDYSKKFGCPVTFLPQCGDDRDIGYSGRTVTRDIVFIGNFSSQYHLGRSKVLEELSRVNLSVELITGEGYSRDTKYIYANAPFCLSMSPNAKGYTSNRLYNILSSGGFCLSKYFDGIEDLFENHKHLCWFKTGEEAREIVDYYYEHPEEYEIIKKKGKELYDAKHTAAHRIQEIIAVCS